MRKPEKTDVTDPKKQDFLQFIGKTVQANFSAQNSIDDLKIENLIATENLQKGLLSHIRHLENCEAHLGQDPRASKARTNVVAVN